MGVIICLTGELFFIFNNKNENHSTEKEKGTGMDYRVIIGILIGLSHCLSSSVIYDSIKVLVNSNVSNYLQFYYLGFSNFFLGVITMFCIGGLDKLLNIALYFSVF